ncbi:AraC family transcriptional regulator [Paenibacillus sp.]|uniref:AraC family transcriptional regulator n=1 Tax=Paenibacillus sp. TaxID=58172 RepID=UPI0028122704|nr:AraC family transcriptional regulator [Paenibacillus sp.]
MLVKLMRFLTLLVVATTLIISGSYIAYYSYDIKHDIRRSAEATLERLFDQASLLHRSLDALSLQISLDAHVNELLRNPFQADILEFRSIKDQMQNQIAANPMIHSMYIYFKLDHRVLTTTEGLYRLSEFYDKPFIDRANELGDKMEWNQIRTLNDSVSGKSYELLTITKPLPLANKESLGMLVINVKKKEFLNMLYDFSRVDVERQAIFLLDQPTERVISGPNRPALAAALEELIKGGALDTQSGMKVRKLNGKTYFVSYYKVMDYPWTAVMLTPFETFASEFARKIAEVAQVSLLVVAFGFVLSFLFSRRFVQPWRKMIHSYFDGTFGPRGEGRDETVLVQQGISGLIDENKAFKDALEQSTPVVRSRLIYDMLTDAAVDKQKAEEGLSEFGIVFHRSHFLTLLVGFDMRALEHDEGYTNVKPLLFSYIESSLKTHWFVIGTILEGNHFGYIINLDSASLQGSVKVQLKQVCDGIIEQSINRFNVFLQFAFGDLCDSLDKVHTSYYQAKRVIHCKALISATDVVFFHDIEYDPSVEYPLELHNELIRHMLTCRSEKAAQTLETFIETYVDNMDYSREAIQEIVLMMMSGIVRSLYEQGYPLNRTGYSTKLVFELKHHGDLKRFLRGFVADMVEQIESWRTGHQDNAYLAKAMEYMEGHYRTIESVSDIAAHVGISTNYLSRIFREGLGKSPLDALTKLRIERSKQLLTEDDYKYSLKEICSLIGYNDVQSFIRFFKKLENVTPGEYRKMLLAANRRV